jgi:hypothetical protein
MSKFNCKVVSEVPVSIINNIGGFVCFVVLKIGEKERIVSIFEKDLKWYLENYIFEKENVADAFERYTLISKKN